jgi:N-acetylneuraminic acid mutarotase
MVIWGGAHDFEADPLTDGAAFDPATRAWRKLPAAPLSPRFDARAMWTGKEMIIFGGGSVEDTTLGDGAAWDPATNTWRSLPASPIGARDGAVVVWAGDRLVVWGGSTVLPPDAPDGSETEMKSDGAAYVPATNTWVPVAAAPIPARTNADSVWTGSRLVVSGGYHEGDDDDRTDGAAFDPISGAWSPIAARPAPGSCGGGSACAGIWTGKVALFPVSGQSYDPAANRWSAMAPPPATDGPAPGEPSVWTGGRLLTWGISGGDSDGSSGDDSDGGAEPAPPPSHGALYDPVANRWQTFDAGPLSSRVSHTAVWTGQEMLVWGGTGGETPLADGAAYRPE